MLVDINEIGYVHLYGPLWLEINNRRLRQIMANYNEDKKIKAPLAIQNHHSLTDGYHIGHFLDNLNRHLEDPALITQPFSSSFK
jgi:hypothetical protein